MCIHTYQHIEITVRYGPCRIGGKSHKQITQLSSATSQCHSKKKCIKPAPNMLMQSIHPVRWPQRVYYRSPCRDTVLPAKNNHLDHMIRCHSSHSNTNIETRPLPAVLEAIPTESQDGSFNFTICCMKYLNARSNTLSHNPAINV